MPRLACAGHSVAKPALEALLASCLARQPQLVEQAELMMGELEETSVLRIEQWHIALLELQVKYLMLTIDGGQ